MILPVPYYSQHRDVEDAIWRPRACGMTCLKMVLDYYAPKLDIEVPSLDDLIEEGISIEGYSAHGWIHDKLVLIAHNYGMPAYREEFRTIIPTRQKALATRGLRKILDFLHEGKPVIVSVEGNFEDGGDFHQVVLVGFEKEGSVDTIIYHEPAAQDETGKNRRVAKETFLKHWRNLGIFIG